MKLLFVILQMILLTSCATEPRSPTDLAPQSESLSTSIAQDSHSYGRVEDNINQYIDTDSTKSNEVQSNAETNADTSTSTTTSTSTSTTTSTSMTTDNSMSTSNPSTSDTDSSAVVSSESLPQESANSTPANDTYIYDNIVKFHDITINLMNNVGELQLIPDGDVLYYNMGAGDFDSIRYSYEGESFSLEIINDTGSPRRYSECKIDKFETSGKAILAGNIQVGVSTYSQVIEKYGKPARINGSVATWEYSTGKMELTFNQGTLSNVCIDVK